MTESFLVEKINSILNFCQKKLSFLCANSCILSGIDNIIFALIFLTIILTTVATSGLIGLFATSVIALSILKLLILKGQKLEFQLFDFALIIYLIFCIISTINSTLFHQSLYGLNKTLIYMGFYFSVVQYIKNNKDKIIYIIMLIGLLVSAESFIGILQQKAGVLAGATWQDTANLNPEEIMTRVYGTIKPLNPNLYAAYLIAGFWGIPCLFLQNVYNKNLKRAIILLLLALIEAIAVFLSGCRGAYIGLLAFGVMFIIFGYRILDFDFNISNRVKKLFAAAVGIFISLGTVIVLSTPAIFKRILSIFTIRGDSSSSFRMNVYNAGLEMFRDNFLFGIGVGNKVFREIYGLYMMSGFDALSAYCIYLEIGIESGIFALISFVTFLAILIFKCIVFINTKIKITDKIIILTAFASLCGVMMHGLVDTVFFRPPVQILFWSMIAILNVKLSSEVNYEKN